MARVPSPSLVGTLYIAASSLLQASPDVGVATALALFSPLAPPWHLLCSSSYAERISALDKE